VDPATVLSVIESSCDTLFDIPRRPIHKALNRESGTEDWVVFEPVDPDSAAPFGMVSADQVPLLSDRGREGVVKVEKLAEIRDGWTQVSRPIHPPNVPPQTEKVPSPDQANHDAVSNIPTNLPTIPTSPVQSIPPLSFTSDEITTTESEHGQTPSTTKPPFLRPPPARLPQASVEPAPEPSSPEPITLHLNACLPGGGLDAPPISAIPQAKKVKRSNFRSLGLGRRSVNPCPDPSRVPDTEAEGDTDIIFTAADIADEDETSETSTSSFDIVDRYGDGLIGADGFLQVPTIANAENSLPSESTDIRGGEERPLEEIIALPPSAISATTTEPIAREEVKNVLESDNDSDKPRFTSGNIPPTSPKDDSPLSLASPVSEVKGDAESPVSTGSSDVVDHQNDTERDNPKDAMKDEIEPTAPPTPFLTKSFEGLPFGPDLLAVSSAPYRLTAG